MSETGEINSDDNHDDIIVLNALVLESDFRQHKVT